MDIIQNREYFVALIQRVLQVPRAMHATMSLRKDLERCFEGYAEVVPCAPNSPEEVGMALLRSFDDAPVREN